MDLEGGAEGSFGMIPVAFCPTCYACCVEMAAPHYEDPDLEQPRALDG
jgi:hypothetical protein